VTKREEFKHISNAERLRFHVYPMEAMEEIDKLRTDVQFWSVNARTYEKLLQASPEERADFYACAGVENPDEKFAALRGRGEEVVVAEGPVDYIGRSVYMMVDGGAHTETEFHRNAAEVIRALVEDGQRVQVVLRKIGDGEVGK